MRAMLLMWVIFFTASVVTYQKHRLHQLSLNAALPAKLKRLSSY